MKYLRSFLCVGLLLAGIVITHKDEDHLVDTADVINAVPTNRKVVALTFDDGPLSLTTPQVLEVLKEKNVKATFFVVGKRAEQFPQLLSREVEAGHEIGNHSYDHHRLTQLSEERIGDELSKSETIIEKMAVKPNLFRPPEGKYNSAILQMARERGYSVILWSVDPNDWRVVAPGKIANTVMSQVKPGSIILLHDGISPSGTPEALALIIDDLVSQGYEFMTVSELLQYYSDSHAASPLRQWLDKVKQII